MIPADLPTTDALLQAALEYARQGWPVMPLHTPINGICDCPKGPDCTSAGKHPRTMNGLKDATVDELKIRRWWKSWGIANIGLAVPEGFAVVDVDGQEGWEALRDAGRALPATAIQTTGRGSHYVYRTLDRVPPRSHVMPKVDLRGPGSYIVAGPSVHATGNEYRWEIPLSQVDTAPLWLVEVGRQSGGTTEGPRAPVDFNLVLAGLPEGSRKWELYRAAAKLRAANVPIELAIDLAVRAAANCTPPLEAKEAERKVREAYAKYPPNASPRDLPAGVTLLSHDSVMVEFETCRFVFSDMEKTGRELRAEMEVQSLLPGMPREPYTQSLNLLSVSSRDQCRREIEHVLGNEPKGQWVSLISRAVTNAQRAFVGVDRSIRTSEMAAPEALSYIVPDLVPADGLTILFGEGSGGKTFLLMKLALAASRGDLFLGRPCAPVNVLYIDCETGKSTYPYRMRRLCAGEGLDLDAAANVFYWWTDGVPFPDQVEAIKRCCEQNQIGLLCLDHIAAACGGDATEQAIASAFSRAHGKIGLPMVALAHITGAASSNPESAQRPFGSVYWHNNARRTYFVLRQQEAESPVADLGIYPRKINDGSRPLPFGVRVTFEDPAGPITVDAGDLRANSVLSSARGQEHVIWDMLATPMLAEDIATALGKSERYVKDVMKAHPRLFVEIEAGGRGVKSKWARREARLPYADHDDEPPEDFDFGEPELPF